MSGTGVTAAAGFRAAGVHCGIRRKNPDLALIVSDGPATASWMTPRRAVLRLNSGRVHYILLT